MANAVFDDDNPLTRHLWSYPDTNSWDAKRNTAELVKMLPLYASSINTSRKKEFFELLQKITGFSI